MARLDEIAVYPIKSLEPTTLERTTVIENGALQWDRRYAIVDEAGEYVNGKRDERVHRLETTYDLERSTVTIGERDGETTRTYHLDVDRDALEAWLSAFFEYRVRLVRDDEGGYPDDTTVSGPTVIAWETLEAVAGWFDGIDATGMFRRLRPNLVLEAETAFWEDRLYDEPGTVQAFEIGDVSFRGSNPCQRCVVPTRHPDTGEPTPGFQETFVENRERTLPAWASREWFDHYFRLMVNTDILERDWGASLRVGDEVRIGEVLSAP